MSFKKTAFIVLLFIAITAFAFKVENTSYTTFSRQPLPDSTDVGKQLALQYCQSCHIFPEPDLLDKKTWLKNVLPNMGMRLGLRDVGKNPFQGMSPEEELSLKQLNIYPDSPLISRADWAEIIKYYEKQAPNEPLEQKTVAPIADRLPQFKAGFMTFTKKKSPKTSLLKYDPAASLLYIGDAQNELFVVDSLFHLKATFNTPTPSVDIDFPKNGSPRLLTIGSITPSDEKQGRWMPLDSTIKTAQSIDFKDLPRPVQFATSDFNKDGKEDVVICGFGNNVGKLAWYDNLQPTKEHILKALPGARKVEIKDFNNDKKPDIMVLMAQAQESISIFYNQGHGKFKERTVLKFPPVYGVSYFELADFNKDGFADILLTNGDNWDYSAIRKNYHGIRIYLNDGHDNFKETWFYPMYGTSKAVARDFDNDGNLDIAAISFYSDLDQPEHSFIYLANQGNLNFKAYTTPEAANGKWLTMEVGDFDKDGDLDIVLGSYFHNLGEMTKLMFNGVSSFPQLLVLTNKKK